ncbi:MAG: VanZ family protein [Thermodesulfobacteriota bacterium]
MNLVLRWIFLALYLLLVVFLSLSSNSPKSDELWGIGIDKFYHAGAYAVMGILASNATRPWKSFGNRTTAIIAATIFCILFGALMEGAQYLTHVRQTSLLDIIANGIGAVTGATLYMTLLSRRPMNKIS